MERGSCTVKLGSRITLGDVLSKGSSLLISLPSLGFSSELVQLRMAWYIATHLFVGAATRISYATAVRGGVMGAILNGGSARDFAMLGAAMTVWFLGSTFRKTVRLQEQPIWFRWSMYYALILALVYLNAYDDVGFVYFQF